MDQAIAQIEEKNVDSLKRIIMQMKIKKENGGMF